MAAARKTRKAKRAKAKKLTAKRGAAVKKKAAKRRAAKTTIAKARVAKKRAAKTRAAKKKTAKRIAAKRAAAKGGTAKRRTVHAQFHADLSDAHPGEDYWVSVNGDRILMQAHTEETLAKAFAEAPHLRASAKRANSQITHFAAQTVAMHTDCVTRVHLRHSMKNFPNAKSKTGVGHSAIFIPPRGAELAKLGADAVVHAVPIDYLSTARCFLFHHPELINQDVDLTGDIFDYMEDDRTVSTAINNLALLMRSMGQPTEFPDVGWATLVPFTPPKNPETGMTGETYYQQTPSIRVTGEARNPLGPLLIWVQNNPTFKDKKWTVQPGEAVVPASGPAPMARAARSAARAAKKKSKAAARDSSWQAALANNAAISGCKTAISILDPDKKKLKITMENNYIRYLGAYIRFYNAKGEALKVPNWKPDDAGIPYDLAVAMGIQYDDVRYMGLLSPNNCVLAIPFPPPGKLQTEVTFPPGAVSASVYGSGLGVGYNPWPKTPALGGILTGTFNLGVPAFMLGFGVASQTYKPLYDIIQTLTSHKAFMVAAGLFVAGWAGYIIGSSVNNKEMNWSSFTSLVGLLFNVAASKALLWVELTVAANKVVEQIPFAGWLMLTLNIFTGIAQMAQTIIAIATSDWNIENRIATSITTKVTVHPDPRNKSFPQGGAKRSCVVKMIYQDQTRPTVQKTVDVGEEAKTLLVEFPANTLGGQVKFEADFYVDRWMAAKATTGVMDNDDKNVAALSMYLVQLPVPLDNKSIYSHARLLTYTNGAYGWTDTPDAPQATIASRNTSRTGNALGDWTGITLSQRFGMIGFAWQAAGMGIVDCDTQAQGQLYAFQNINIPGTPMNAVEFPSCGFTGQSRLIYDSFPPKFLMKDGNWVIDPSTGRPTPDPTDIMLGQYYVDPRLANVPFGDGGGYHLRKVTLDPPTPFDMSKNQPSYGRFAFFPDSVALHPSRLVIGVNARYKKLQIVTLNKNGAADADVQLGQIGSGPATDQTRPGLMFNPVAVTCTTDGTIIVLEDTKSSSGREITAISRLSAYDLHMNPVNRFFDGLGHPSPWLYLSQPKDYYYLDLTSTGDEQMTYIYVLYYIGTGAAPSDYHMAIYTYGQTPPTQNPLVVTDSIPVARVAVDMWRSAYTLNFAMVTDGKGNPAGPTGPGTGPAGRTVPSVSMWLPPIPTR
jgi:hypothetical protein